MNDNCNKSNIAVLLIDMQKKFLKDISPKNLDIQIMEQKRVLKYCSEKNVPVIVVEYSGHGQTTKLLDLNNLLGKYKPLIKNFDDAFEIAELSERLDNFGVKELGLMGVNRGVCVLDTARSAIELGYKIHTAKTLIEDSNILSTKRDYEWYEKNG
ncbi:MAG: isochorismatase family protein, partial [Nanoarchaeota archaeon]|nr:isochorismatase family protein [Nanoarchaeota archaeon]